MCGIFAQLKPKTVGVDRVVADVIEACDQIKHRGPDDTKHVQVTDQLFFGFHRLAIVGLDHESNEPLYSQKEKVCSDYDGRIILICNGEIYNYKELIAKYDLEVDTHNDCEVLIRLYEKFGIEKMIQLLDGVFSFILYDGRYAFKHSARGHNEEWLFIGNDPIGIRPLYEGRRADGAIAWASEPVALRDICDQVSFFPPGCYQTIDLTSSQWNADNKLLGNLVGLPGEKEKKRYFHYSWNLTRLEPHEIYGPYRSLLEDAVRKRVMMGDRPMACLLSGGLDSSLISALVAKYLRIRFQEAIRNGVPLEDGNEILHTFSIGFEGSPDLKYARIVSEFIGTNHHEVVMKPKEFLAAIPEVIQAIQSFDVTTVRASVGNYLLAKHIRSKTDFKIIFNGDVSEEINGSYFYARYAPSDWAFFQDNIRLLKEVHKYDVLRSARSIEHFGMEARTPFADKNLVNFVMSLPPKYKRFGTTDQAVFPIEKMLLRSACQDLLPAEVVWRPKMAFSDGVSKKELSWHDIIQDYVSDIVNESEFVQGQKKWLYPRIFSKEAYLYRKIYNEMMGERQDMISLIGEYWMPRFIEANDPSARVLGSS